VISAIRIQVASSRFEDAEVGHALSLNVWLGSLVVNYSLIEEKGINSHSNSGQFVNK
jgi:hypothetical protein